MFGRRLLRVSMAIAALALCMSAAPAGAEGLFEFLFGKMGGGGQPAAAPAPEASERRPMSLTVRPRQTGLGGGTLFCVRLCDGRYFPIHRGANVQPGQLCNSMCPASKTKVFAGPDISRAIAADGASYTAIDTAFRYREETVENCTCNGMTPYGLVNMDARQDPTLRVGDFVATPAGLVRSVALSKMAQKSGGDDEMTTSALPLGLRGRVPDSEPVQLRGSQATAEIVKPATRASRAKRFHDMFAQRKRAR